MGPAKQSEAAEPAISPALVEEQLRRVLASDLFANSQRLSAFLKFIVENALRGNSGQIKEYLIGTEVFGRNSSYDPRTDPVVRVEAGRLRLKLAEYYRTQGSHDPVLIELPKGRYAPLFRQQWGDAQGSVPKVVETPKPQPRQQVRNLPALVASLGLILLTIVTGYYYLLHWRTNIGTAFPSIAVLPFVNVGASGVDQYLGDGVAEELTTGLSQLHDLRVVAATSAFQFRGKSEDVRHIGQLLDAQALLEGSIAHSGGGIRINAQLVSTKNGYHLWSKVYEVDAGGIFDAEDDIVRQTARVLAIPIAPGRNLRGANGETRNPEAHDLYLQGRYFWSKRDLLSMEKAIELFQAAIRKDPNFALAYAGLADTYVVLGGNAQKPLAEVVPPARAAITRAMELDPSLAEVHATLALLDSESTGRRRGLEAELRRAIELSPSYASAHHWLGIILTSLKRFDEADAELRKAQLLDPLSPVITEAVAENYYAWRRYDDAMTTLQQIQKMNSSIGEELTGRVYAQKGMFAEAINLYNSVLQREPSPQILNDLALVYAASGQKLEARRLLSQATGLTKQYVSPYWIAVTYVRLGETETAFQWLERAYQEQDPMMGSLMVDPMLDPIRSDTRYMEFLRKADLIQ